MQTPARPPLPPALLHGLGPHVRVQRPQQQPQHRGRRRHPLAAGRLPPAVTPFVWLVVWVAMSSGFLLGFADGEATLFIDGFRVTFFPELSAPSSKLPHPEHIAPFCAAMERRAQLYQALPWLGTTAGALASGWLAKARGRRAAIAAGCALFAAGKVLLATAFHTPQIFVAQAVAGAAFGLLLQAPMLEMLEVAPFHARGTLAATISLGRAVGMLCASLLTFGLGLAAPAWGWRLVPVFAIGPALLTLGLLRWLPETASSLVLRGKVAEGRLALARVRGLLAASSEAEAEFGDILAAAELSSSRSRTQLAVLAGEPTCWVPLLLSLGVATLVAGSGSLSIPAINLPLFAALDYGGLQGYVMSLILVNVGALGGALGALALADSLGRRLGVAACMLTASAAFGALALLLQLLYGSALAAGGPLPLLPTSVWAAAALLMLANGCCFAGNTSLVWIYAFEIQPLRTRALSTGITIAALALQMFVWILFGVPLLCATRGVGLFGLYSVLSAAVALVALLLFVQTVGCPLEQVGAMWQQHPIWQRFFGGRGGSDGGSGSGVEDADQSFPGLQSDASEVGGSSGQQQQQQLHGSKQATARAG